MQVEHPPEDASRWPQLAVLRSDRAVSPFAVGGHVAVAVVRRRDGRVRDGRVLVQAVRRVGAGCSILRRAGAVADVVVEVAGRFVRHARQRLHGGGQRLAPEQVVLAVQGRFSQRHCRIFCLRHLSLVFSPIKKQGPACALDVDKANLHGPIPVVFTVNKGVVDKANLQSKSVLESGSPPAIDEPALYLERVTCYAIVVPYATIVPIDQPKLRI